MLIRNSGVNAFDVRIYAAEIRVDRVLYGRP